MLRKNLMLQLLPQNDVLVPNTKNPHRAVDYINSYIDSVSCDNLNVDISFMNIIDACYVSTMCSTNHYIKYPEGKINWIVSSKHTAEISKPLNLGNSEFYYA